MKEFNFILLNVDVKTEVNNEIELLLYKRPELFDD